MTIRVRYFASLKERLGREADTVPAQSAHTVGQVWAQAVSGEAPPKNLLAAVNLEYADLSTPVKDGDEVAFFPPVTGG
jgi:sulfur-carrier protein